MLFRPELRAEAPSLRDLIQSDQPVAWFSFDEDPDPATVKGSIARVEGPDRRVSLTLPEENMALHLKGDGSHLRLPDRADLRFAQGEAITIEAWVRLDGIDPGASAYIISKGRSTGSGTNQNWALRLAESGGTARLSFLFRSQPSAAKPEGDYHRWNSSAGLNADGKWHHLALSYTFGSPESLKAYIDGRQRSGQWEMGGATTEPPVVDEDVVLIGSSRGGSPANSFKGAIDEMAIYRSALDRKRLLSRYQRVIPDPLPPQLRAVPAGKVLVEIREGVGERDLWPDLDGPADETFAVEAFSLSSLPQVYNARAARRDRKLPLHVRLAAEVPLPPGEHTLLFRTPGLSRLYVDGEEVAKQPYFNISGSAHGQPRPMPERDPGYPRLRMGTQEMTLSLQGDGQRKLLVVEGMVGQPGRRLSLNELLLAIRYEGDESWHLLTAGADRSLAFDAEGFHLYNQRQAKQFSQLEAERRQLAYRQLEGEIRQRHEAARAYLKTLDPLPLPKGVSPEDSPSRIVDAYLLARREAVAGAVPSEPKARPEHAEAVRLLEANCFRCHGEKSSGGLKLNTREAALATGKSGQIAVVPGDPEASEVLYRLLTDDPDEIMPPEGKGLSPEETELVRRWIADGAPWPGQGARLEALPKTLDALSFLRRLYLNTVGVLPTPAEIRDFQALPEETRLARTIDRLLEDPRHADHWVSYWQDALAENPRLIKPVLNNTGPFRYWLHEALLDNRPMDQFAADLLTFQGSVHGGGAGGFSRAAENDVPMAAKAHIVGNAFLGIEMKCALCHDAPYHSVKQEDVYSLAAMLGNKPIVLPESSSVPAAFFQREGKSNSVVKVTLKPGTEVAPKWPFADLAKPDPDKVDAAWAIIRPENRRFAQVLTNRVWKYYFGEGIVEPVHDWEGNEPSHPELLDYLSREFMASGYDLRHLSRILLNTEAFRREARLQRSTSPQDRFFDAPLRRRFSAEQVVDSLLSASGIPNYSEELTFDVEGVFSEVNFLNLGYPERAWQMVSTASDRDRPSLTLTNADSILSVMSAYGWRDERPEPVVERETSAHILQPGMLANGLFGTWATRLSVHSELSRLAVEAASPEALVDEIYLRYLTRLPSAEEKAGFVALLSPGFAERLTGNPEDFRIQPFVPIVRELSWTNHLSVRANEIAADLERKAFAGPPPTPFLSSEWRERMEDAVWALVNSPEFTFVP